MIYMTSDLHFNHQKPFIYEPRGFESVEEMNAAIVKNFNNVVQADDIVYVLGDLCLGGGSDEIKAENKKLIESLNGTLKVVLGNHDTPARIELYQSCCNAEVIGYAEMLKYGKYHFYLSHFPALTSNWDNDKPLKAKLISLAGHSHYQNRFKDMDKGLIYHVECDAHNCTPVSVDEILKDINFFISLDKNAQIELYKKDIY